MSLKYLCRTLALILCVSLAPWSIGQTSSTLSGRVSDAATLGALPGATVQAFVADSVYGTTTDTEGNFRMLTVPTGIHRVVVSYIGYASTEIAEVWVRLGKEEAIIVQLERSANQLGEVLVRGAAPARLNSVSTHTLTVEQSLRYPATFFDPARLATSYAGVASTNDQANHFSVRGNGPASNAWLLEGAEIVNPNHTGNAGTASDLPTLSGGGTTILSAQMLGTSRLLTGGFTTPYGNAVGGIMDLRLRPGTNARTAFTGQAGLLGIDLCAEGPFKKNGRSSYLVNYRYSTLGLLSAMGVNLGDEEISFQDLSFNVNMPVGKAVISVFGMGGNSSNHFAAKDSSLWEFDKDSQNIDYSSTVGVAGLTFRLPVGGNASWSTTAVISQNDQERGSEEFAPRRGPPQTFTYTLSERKLSIVSFVRGARGERFTYQFGGSAMQRTVDKYFDLAEVVQGWLFRPYAQGSYMFGERVRVDAGLGYAHYTANGSSVVEPRFAVNWRIGTDRSLALSIGQRSQLPSVQFFPVRTASDILQNTTVGLTRSQDIVLAYDHPIRPHLIFHAEVFHQRLLDVPVADTSGVLFGSASAMSMVNVWDAPVVMDLANRGEGLNRGVELGLQYHFHNNFFYQANLSFFDAVFTDAFGNEYNARWNTGLMGNVVVGKEFPKQKDQVKRTWGVNGRLNAMGGQRIPASSFESASPWSDQYDPFYRLDLRIYRKMERKGHTGMWSLDLLNATNVQNEAYRYFDQRAQEVVTKYQLGLIPNLSYRIEF